MKELYYAKQYATIPEKNWQVQINPSTFNEGDSALGNSFAKML